MIHRVLRIGRWIAEFFFAPDGYDVRRIMEKLEDEGAPAGVMSEVYDKLKRSSPNEGFTWADEKRRIAVVVVGPSSSGAEFLDSFVHEIGHFADHVANSLGLEPDSEGSKYILGDTAREFMDLVCELGCPHCNY